MRQLAETKGHSTLPHQEGDHARAGRGGVEGGALPMSAGTSFHGRRKPNGPAFHCGTMAGVHHEAERAIRAMLPLKRSDAEKLQRSEARVRRGRLALQRATMAWSRRRLPRRRWARKLRRAPGCRRIASPTDGPAAGGGHGDRVGAQAVNILPHLLPIPNPNQRVPAGRNARAANEGGAVDIGVPASRSLERKMPAGHQANARARARPAKRSSIRTSTSAAT